MTRLWSIFIRTALGITFISALCPALAEPSTVGIVILHGKGGSPRGHVADLARALEGKGYQVTTLEMAWSGRRDYDVPVNDAEKELQSAVNTLRGKGAQRVFVAGHSQGGAFALHFAGQHSLDGIIAIAPGGDVGSRLFREQLGASVARARRLVADGKGDEKVRLDDYEGSKGMLPVVTAPSIYLTWFDPEGAMNLQRAARAANPHIPILWIVAQSDYPGLRKANIPLFDSLPRHPLTKLYEPNSDHVGAPSASLEEIVRWTTEVVKTAPR